jgi:hypothetical protein
MTDPYNAGPDNADAAEPDREIVLAWVTDWPGLEVYAPVPASGRYPRDRHGNPYYRGVRLRTDAPEQPPHRPVGLLSDADWTWMIRSDHIWRHVTDRFGAQAQTIALALARAGCLTIGHDLQGSRPAPTPKRVYPHPDLAAAEKDRRAHRRDRQTTLQSRAGELAADLRDEWPGVAQALHATDHPDRLSWVVDAANDLANGIVHDSVRAFVQTHAGDTKARDDVQRLLTDLGFEPDALAALGLSRNPYIGIGGPISLRTINGSVDLSLLPGPHDIRLSPRQPIHLDVHPGTGPLLIIENRQAAETLGDTHPELPVIWCHGQPPDPVVALITEAAGQRARTLICTDADLGGVRIAARIHDHLGADTPVRIIDVGTAPHDPGRVFSTHNRTHLEAFTARTDQIGAFARSCLARSYAIEQEATVRTALNATLNT